MSAWVYIRGWLEFYGQKADAEQIIRRGDPAGWAFPEGGWLDAACYARAVRSQYSDDVLDQVREIAALPATDEDDDRVCGLFLVFHEEGHQTEWQIRDGQVLVGQAPARYDYLWH
ncbi:hypothetical protein [Spirillospora sp. NPDC048819]|uniref:hypothetical protein n=1 Tax=Spirillospora sp. NPDC048819 TaxID=3155268 RepID=UPI00340F44B7